MPPQRPPGPPAAAARPMPQAGPPGAVAGPPPQAGPPAAPVPGQVPPQFAKHIDPNNPLQAEMVKRAGSLQPQESHAFFEALTLPVLVVLKKLLPELGFIWDGVIQAKQQGGGQAAPAPSGAPAAVPQPMPPRAMPPQAPPQAGLRRL